MTACIGRNESGKTNFLEALATFDLDHSYDESELPIGEHQRLRRENDPSDIRILTLVFETDGQFWSDDRPSVESITVEKFFDDHYEIEIETVAGRSTMTFEGWEGWLIEYAEEWVSGQLDEFEPEYLRDDDTLTVVGDEPSPEQLHEHIEELTEEDRRERSIADVLSDDVESSGVDAVVEDAFSELQSRLEDADTIKQAEKSVNHFTSRLRNLDSALADKCSENGQEVKSFLENGRRAIESEEMLGFVARRNVSTPKVDVLIQLPEIFLHRNVERLEDKLTVGDIAGNPDDHRTFNNLLELVDIDPEELRRTSTQRRRTRLKGASVNLSEQLNDAWTQEKVTVTIDIDGEQLSVYVVDESAAPETETRPSQRSDGFQQFLSFYINFLAETGGKLADSILLFDDPGTLLHPSGKKDLLETFRTLSETNQVIYDTHSPFLIEKDRLRRVRIVERPGSEGTTISSDLHHKTDYDVLEPLRAALGVTISDSLIGNEKNVLVEGRSDQLYLNAVSNYFRRRNRADSSLDPDRVSVVSVGGADKMPYFARLLATTGREYVVVLDGDQKGQSVKKELRDETGVESERVKTLNELVSGLGDSPDTEDLLDRDLLKRSAVANIIDHPTEEVNETIGELPQTGAAAELDKQLWQKFGIDLAKLKIDIAREVEHIAAQEDCSDDDLGTATVENYVELFDGIQQLFD
jgi:predicted ATP-dependent endonuclease of OLD family